jgi:hypothetical protein
MSRLDRLTLLLAGAGAAVAGARHLARRPADEAKPIFADAPAPPTPRPDVEEPVMAERPTVAPEQPGVAPSPLAEEPPVVAEPSPFVAEPGAPAHEPVAAEEPWFVADVQEPAGEQRPSATWSGRPIGS